MGSKHSGLCPFCGDSVKPALIEDNSIRRDVCECPSCKEKIFVCRTPGCTNYAKGGTIYDDELCPSCTESITSGVGEVLKYGVMAVAGAVGSAIAVTMMNKKD
jgi:hypothetical protein